MSNSKGYQHIFIEIGMEAEVLNNYSNEDGLAFASGGVDTEIAKCQEKLIAAVKKLINTVMTRNQKRILNMTLEDKTQSEIAKKLGICQTAVHKAIHGNLDYLNRDSNNRPKRYGGAMTKLKRACARDPEVQKWLAEIARLKTEE